MVKRKKRTYHRRSPEEQIAALEAQIAELRQRSHKWSPTAVKKERDRLELSAADYGELVGVSGLTIYNWEKGTARPRAKLMDKWVAVRGIGKREAWRRLGYA